MRTLSSAFHPANKGNKARVTLGFAPSQELTDFFDAKDDYLDDNPTARLPELLKLKLPENTLMTREESREMDSALRLEDGSWPDEVYPEFDPDYVHPRH